MINWLRIRARDLSVALERGNLRCVPDGVLEFELRVVGSEMPAKSGGPAKSRKSREPGPLQKPRSDIF